MENAEKRTEPERLEKENARENAAAAQFDEEIVGGGERGVGGGREEGRDAHKGGRGGARKWEDAVPASEVKCGMSREDRKLLQQMERFKKMEQEVEHGSASKRTEQRVEHGSASKRLENGSASKKVDNSCGSKKVDNGSASKKIEQQVEHGSAAKRVEHGSANKKMEQDVEHGSASTKAEHDSARKKVENGSVSKKMEQELEHGSGSKKTEQGSGCKKTKLCEIENAATADNIKKKGHGGNEVNAVVLEVKTDITQMTREERKLHAEMQRFQKLEAKLTLQTAARAAAGETVPAVGDAGTAVALAGGGTSATSGASHNHKGGGGGGSRKSPPQKTTNSPVDKIGTAGGGAGGTKESKAGAGVGGDCHNLVQHGSAGRKGSEDAVPRHDVKSDSRR